MLLTITAMASAASMTSVADDATDLGHLLHKHPDRVQSFSLPMGTAHVFYPEASESRCTAALFVEVDPIGVVRRNRVGHAAFALAEYVNDRPYAASSLLSVAIARVFGTAMNGVLASRPHLPGTPLSLELHLPVVASRGGLDLPQRFFGPLGWDVTATPIALDPKVVRWGPSEYVDLRLTGTMRLSDALTQLYVLVPALDGAKHYWVSDDEVDKLVSKGGTWLAEHPERDLILRRTLAGQRTFVADAVARLSALEDVAPGDAVATTEAREGEGAAAAEAPGASVQAGAARPLAAVRADEVVRALVDVGAHSVVDLGCGEGALLALLLRDARFTSVVGVDVSASELERATRRLNLDRMPDSQRARLTLLQGSATYRDDRLIGADALVLMEVIEHVDLDRLPALERSVFAWARPGTVIVTTPNSEYNVMFPRLSAGTMRHPDHRFEWTRAQFRAWAHDVGTRYGYTVAFRAVGDEHEIHGAPTQLAVFRRLDERSVGERSAGDEASARTGAGR